MPLAVTESRRVGWVNDCAREAGVLPGMHESSAAARAADIVLIARDAGREAGALTEVALWALHFTPQVSLMRRQHEGLLLEVSASLRLFNGRDALIGQLRQGVEELGMQPCIASAPTASAAWLFACHRDDLHGGPDSFADLLDALPVLLLPSVQPHAAKLAAIGCDTLGQLRRLPRAGLVRRFGKEVLRELDRAFGLEPEALAWFEAPASFHARIELPARVDSVEALLFAARRLLMQMTGWLVARHAAVSAFALMLHHDSLRSGEACITELPIRLASPSRDLAHLSLLLQEHMARVTLDASVIELSLKAEDISELAAPNTELFPAPASQAETTGRLIERLASRLGEEAITRLKVVGDHRPERCSMAVSAHAALHARMRQSNRAGFNFPPRPAWLLREPVALLVKRDKPFYQSFLTLLAGPERIEAGWWDDALITRDYYIACNDAHLLLWVYRERHGAQGEKEAEPGWFLHGFFA
ncbi:protein ImuB [Noviherbaspirillum humi]|uniref:Protein ImuB n=2 Tax=Noviherbaspirillum humi TaxID=1688639 RepID=A0A239KU26_9BURK|nr:protein ImuB [Noviherbaspirillum humi]